MKVACLHGELSKMQRQTILAQFVAGRFRALVCVFRQHGSGNSNYCVEHSLECYHRSTLLPYHRSMLLPTSPC